MPKPHPLTAPETTPLEEGAESPREVRSPGERRKKTRPIVIRSVVAAVLLAAAAWGVMTIRFLSTHAETDDAQVEAHIAPVLPKVSGYVTDVLVEDNQKVTAGQPLVRIDPRELATRVNGAQAAVENARAKVDVAAASADSAKTAVAVARAAEAGARANLASAKVALQKATSDLARLTPLHEKQEVSRQQYDAAVSARDAALAHVEAANAQIASATAQVATAERQAAAAVQHVAEARTDVQQKDAALSDARLQASYVTIVAPASGTVSKKNVEVGQFVQTGQPLLAVVDDARPWVVANFKETQLRKMRVGQEVEVDVDAYPGHPFKGRVESLSGATGAKFALLPPDNATGNFVKVVQRVPVKIVLTEAPDALHPLRAGMSVGAVVRLD